MPDLCTMVLDIRYLPGMTPHKDVEKVLEKLKSEDPELDYEIQVTPDDLGPPGMPWENFKFTVPPQDVSPDEVIVKVHAQNCKYVSEKEPIVGAIPVDHPSHFKMYWTNDDSSLTKGRIISFCCGLAGEGTSRHRCVEIDSMVRVSKNFALTAYDICTKSKE